MLQGHTIGVPFTQMVTGVTPTIGVGVRVGEGVVGVTVFVLVGVLVGEGVTEAAVEEVRKSIKLGEN